MFAVKFVTEQGQPVERPHWIAEGIRRRDFGSYVGVQWQVTTRPEQVATWVNRATAERWAAEISGAGREFQAVPAPEGSPA